MGNRNFNEWISGFRDSIADYGYYIDFKKRHNLEETFDVTEHIYNINDMENGIIEKIIK